MVWIFISIMITCQIGNLILMWFLYDTVSYRKSSYLISELVCNELPHEVDGGVVLLPHPTLHHPQVRVSGGKQLCVNTLWTLAMYTFMAYLFAPFYELLYYA